MRRPKKFWAEESAPARERIKHLDKTTFTLEVEPRQVFREAPLTAEGRRLLLGASIRLLGRRFSCGRPIFREDVLRVARLADDAPECAA